MPSPIIEHPRKLSGLDDNALLRQKALVIALLASLLLWHLPFGGLVLYPFKLLATWMHEMSHGVIMLLTGTGFDYVEIFRDTSGMAHAKSAAVRPAAAIIASAGYMGVPLLGAIMLIAAQTFSRARAVLAVLGILLVGSAIVFVANTFGIVALSVGGAGCLTLAALPYERAATFAVNFIACQACINAVLDIRVLFRTHLVVNGEVMRASDAHNMAEATFGSAWMWAAVWLVWSFALFFIALRIVAKRARMQGGATVEVAEASAETSGAVVL